MPDRPFIDSLRTDGYVILPAVFNASEIDALTVDLAAALAQPAHDAESIRDRAGNVYGGRNLLALCAAVREIWRRPSLTDLLAETLGPNCGLVRALFFDKPPERTWSLPWHKDLTIAVRDNRRPSSHFTKPTIKAGVPHVEAPRDILENMLTLRIHLDAVTDENGPLQVIAGSHRDGLDSEASATDSSIRTMIVERGDVLALRPLLTHNSLTSRPGTHRHRRILHLEFAASPVLRDEYEWQNYFPLDAARKSVALPSNSTKKAESAGLGFER